MPRLRRSLAALFPVFLAGACVDGTPLSPTIAAPPAGAVPALQCEVDVHAEALSCSVPNATQTNLAIAANRMVGGQDVYVKLANVGGSYDAGTEIFEINVTVQNLLRAALGTTDGTTVSGVRVFFFDGPTVTAGTGDVTVANATGQAFITAPNQDYFEYAQILQPYEVSAAMAWRFNVPTSVTRFSFVVYVHAPQADETQPLLDKVWTGATNGEWTNAGNWKDGLVPDSASAVSVPTDSMMASGYSMPVLLGNSMLTHLRVGGGMTLDLSGYTLTAMGNVDVPGSITSGTLSLKGSNVLLRGTLPAVQISGSTRLQGSTKAAGAVSISGGSLVVSGSNPLSIAIP